MKRIPGEEKFIDFDEESNCWGIFGVESGFCYSLHWSEANAEEMLKRWEAVA